MRNSIYVHTYRMHKQNIYNCYNIDNKNIDDNENVPAPRPCSLFVGGSNLDLEGSWTPLRRMVRRTQEEPLHARALFVWCQVYQLVYLLFSLAQQVGWYGNGISFRYPTRRRRCNRKGWVSMRCSRAIIYSHLLRDRQLNTQHSSPRAHDI